MLLQWTWCPNHHSGIYTKILHVVRQYHDFVYDKLRNSLLYPLKLVYRIYVKNNHDLKPLRKKSWINALTKKEKVMYGLNTNPPKKAEQSVPAAPVISAVL